ncbi:kelch-like protein 13 isoform X1 [Stegostoma tigrinum]|uniref:kelch-like protein 13 isoform X1 n=1 Tax=Stegostoma tigrinum TaxID=3053191 RepID=UPI00202B71D9|nr:kelch-like protein 13 isoform X1 [Stegostoma tigrinum]
MSTSSQDSVEHQQLISEAYPSRLLEGLHNLRTENILCDIILEAEGVTFPAHKVILASVSSYCKLLIESQHTKYIRLNVTAKGLKQVLDFIYSNRLDLTINNVEDVLKAAENLLVQDVIKLCFRFLEEHLNHRNCLDIFKITQKFGPEELRQKAFLYLGQNYKYILENPCHLVELDKATLCKILENSDIQEYSELELFNCATLWVHHDKNRLKDAAHILKRIRFCLISAMDLQKYVEEISFMKTDSQCNKYLQEALSYHSRLHAQPILLSEHTRIRSNSENMLILGGRTTNNNVCRGMWVADEASSYWRKLGEMPVPLYNHGVVVVNNFVFVLGGQTRFDITGNQPSNEVHRFDPRNSTWLQVAGMLESRTRFYVDAVLDHIISVAGGTLLGQLTNTVEKYKFEENKWVLVAPFPAAVADHTGAVHKSILYISGGFTAGKVVKDLYSYLPRLQRWIINQPMTFARCDHGMATIGDKIFCVGGRTLNSSDEWLHVNETEYYSPVADQWTTLKVSTFDCCQFSTSVHNSKLYITGGGSLRQMTKTDSVFIYDPEAKRWVRAGALPLPLMDHAACMIILSGEVLHKLKTEEYAHPLLGTKKSSTLNLFVTD